MHSIGRYFLLPVPEDDEEKALAAKVFNSVCLSMIAFMAVLGIGTIFVFIRKTSPSITLLV